MNNSNSIFSCPLIAFVTLVIGMIVGALIIFLQFKPMYGVIKGRSSKPKNLKQVLELEPHPGRVEWEWPIRPLKKPKTKEYLKISAHIEANPNLTVEDIAEQLDISRDKVLDVRRSKRTGQLEKSKRHWQL